MSGTPIIEIRDFCKTYGKDVAVDGVSFTVHTGEIFGLLGPNGAGKTTTLECLEGLRSPTSGTLQVAGLNPAAEFHKLRNVIGVQLQSAGLPESITPEEAMRFSVPIMGLLPAWNCWRKWGSRISEKPNSMTFPPGSSGGWCWHWQLPIPPKSCSSMNPLPGWMWRPA